ncbi:MAG TPA: TonB-dependent receptor, partial [Caulobacteraceae bacterium]|nr:TonB-dependent receptor [Caulobacteraceae bacterium]
MHSNNRLSPRLLFAGAAAVAIASAATPAAAQEAAKAPTGAQAADTASVGELVVTARRREENLKDVPISVSAVTADVLDRAGAQDITKLQQVTPNLTLQVARGSNSTLIAFIRGVGQQDPLWGFEPGVGLYVDDVYFARPQGAVLDVFDVDHIEVLRGPQGTLYGRNTIGGAIKYVTRPIGSHTEFDIRGTYGSYNERDLTVSLKTPMGDRMGFSAAVTRQVHDGWGHNLNTGAAQYDKDVAAARFTLEARPTDNLFFRLSGDALRDNSAPRHGHREVPALNIAGQPIAGGEVLPNVYDTRAGIGDTNYVMSEGTSLLGEWTVNPHIKLKSITAYRRGHTDTVIDFDELPQPLLDVPGRYNDHQFSQEFQLVYTSDRVQGVAGFYYLNATASGAFDTVVGQLNLTIGTSGAVDTRSYAGFADFNIDLTDQLSLDVGARYTRDEKTGQVYRQNFTGLRSPLFGATNAVPGLVRSNFTNSRSFEKFTPHVSLSYKITPDISSYVSFSQGFKSGGFDMRADAILTPDSVNGYAPESVDSYEGGVKADVLDHRLQVNAAGFYARYHDQQVTIQTPVGASIASQVENVGQSHMWGGEVEATARVTDELTLNASLGLVKAKFDKYLALDLTVSPPVVRDFASSRVFQNTPEWTDSFGLTWRHSLGSAGSITVTPQASYRSASHMFETPSILDQGAYWLYDA